MKNMKNQIKLILVVFIIILASSCGKSIQTKDTNNSEKSSSLKSEVANEESVVASDSSVSTADIISSKAAKLSKIDSVRKFIRTAEIEFQVSNVFQSTQEIEQLATNMGGFVTNSNLQNEIINSKTKEISDDSSIIIKEYIVKSSLTIRIPREKMDSFLISLSPMVLFIHKRNVTSEDVHLSHLSMELEQLRNQNFANETQQINSKGLENRQASLEAQAKADEAKINQMVMMDKVMYSTINISIYEHSKVKYEKFENLNEDQFEPSFGTRFIHSLKIGLIVLEEIFLLAIKLWGIIAMGLMIYFLAMFIYRKTKKS